jgi:hypothetical protein
MTRLALFALALGLALPTADALAQRRRRPPRDAGAPAPPPPPPPDPATACYTECAAARDQCCRTSSVNGVCHMRCADVGHFCEMDCDRRFPGGRYGLRPPS